MFSRVCNLCNKVDAPVLRLQKCYNRTSKFPKSEIPEHFKDATPIIQCKRTELNYYEGQIYNKFMPIPLASQSWHHFKSVGDHFFINPTINEEDEETIESFTFKDYPHIHPNLIENLERHDITEPSEIQKLAIPKILNGKNVLIAAETGCGKTLAYVIPMIMQIAEWRKLIHREYNSPMGLIITPNRELAHQIGNEVRKYAKIYGLYTKVFTGLEAASVLKNPPIDKVDIAVSVCGLMYNLVSKNYYNLNKVRHVVLEEADFLLDETFERELKPIIKNVPIGIAHILNERGFPKYAQITLASATIPTRISNVLQPFVNVESIEQVTTNKLHTIPVLQKFMRLRKSEKPYQLLKYIKPKILKKQSVIIFSNKSSTANFISVFLKGCNIENNRLYGSLLISDRRKAYAMFRNGQVLVLSTTDAGSRGLDTTMVQHILNYEFPLGTADYIHRCGRIGRLGSLNDCKVTNFISSTKELRVVHAIERRIRKGKPLTIFDIYQNQREETIDEEEIYGEEDLDLRKGEIEHVPY